MTERKFRLLTEKYREMEYKALRERYLELDKHRNDSGGELGEEFYLVSSELDARERKSRPENSPRQKTREAVTWCVKKYKERAKNETKLNQRGIAREATEKFFPELSGQKKAKMIANLRNSYLKKVSKRQHATE